MSMIEGEQIYIMLALWIMVTFLRPFFKAKSNAYFAIRSVLALVDTLRDSTTPGTGYTKHKPLRYTLHHPSNIPNALFQNTLLQCFLE